MAGFTCQICGGNIKMQANQTGVCQGCGMEYDIEAIRAMAGASANTPTVPAPAPTVPPMRAPQTAEDEIDRGTLLAYLNDVRVIETVIDKSEQVLLGIEQKVKSREELMGSIRKGLRLESDTLAEAQRSTVPELSSKKKIVSIVWFVLAAILIVAYAVAASSVQSMGAFLMFLLLGPVEFIIFGIVYMFKYKDEEGQVAYAQYEKEKKIDNIRERIAVFENEIQVTAKENEEVKATANTDKAEVAAELKGFKETLANAYSANIIPMQFRNIEGVYYLYDYLSTSNQSLSEALMQANLEAIKQKLDTMIQLQSAQIIEQRIANAKLGKVLEYSEATMNNTAVAAKYAQIAAVNSELTKKLAAEQLAYQKAEFWLK